MTLLTGFSRALDLILPPRCPTCQKVVTDHPSLCSPCWSNARFISEPLCSCCGLPFEFEVAGQVLCLDCSRCLPPFEAARSVFPYDDFSRDLVLAFKQGDRTDLATLLAGWMVRAAKDLLSQSDVIVPVPLHWRRLLKRRFNQAALLAAQMSKASAIPWDANGLKRQRYTPSQGHLSRMARQKNLKGAFVASPRLKGQRVLLVDDVLTTGATVLNCTQALHHAGAREVRVVTLARVIHNQGGGEGR